MVIKLIKEGLENSYNCQSHRMDRKRIDQFQKEKISPLSQWNAQNNKKKGQFLHWPFD